MAPPIIGSLMAGDTADSATIYGGVVASVVGMLAAVDTQDAFAAAGIVPGGVLTLDHRRVLVVPRQSRALAVSAESRVLTIQGE